MNKRIFSIFLFCITIVASNAHADEDPYAAAIQGYHSDRLKKADAQTINVYDAWADNMAHLIESGSRPGKVIDSNDASGTGNLTIGRGAKINGPIIFKPTNKNTTTIVKTMKR